MDFIIKDNVLLSYQKEYGVTEITIPDNVKIIEHDAFYDCKNLTSIIIPDSVEKIYHHAFSGCKNLKSITIPGSVKRIGCDAFRGSENLTSVIIQNGVTEIGSYAFSECKNLKNVVIPDSIKYIEREVFGNCKNLTSITLPDSIESIHNDAFFNCVNLTDLTITTNINKIKVNLSHKENMNTIKTLKNILSLVRNKDFSARLDLKIKYKLIIDYFFATGNNVSEYYIKKNFSKIMKQCIEDNDTDRINKVLENSDFITKRNIDKFITYAIEKKKQDIFIILTSYKNKTFK